MKVNVSIDENEVEDISVKNSKSYPGSSKKPKRETKVVKKEKKVVVIKEFPSLKNRCSPGSLLGKDCVRAMGFGSLLRMKMIDVPLKIVYYVLDHFNFETLKVEFENCEVSVDSKYVYEMLGLPSGGSLLSNMDYIFENNEESCMFEWKKHYGNIDKLRLKQLKNELVQTSGADDNFRINILSTSMGKCNMNLLYLLERDTDLSSIDWCDFIVNYLVRTKKLLYVDSFKFHYLQVTRKRPTIFYWTSEKIRFLEDILQENGGFGCENEESGDDEDGSDGDEDEEDFDVNQVSVVEVYENKISYMYQKMEDLKKDLVVNINEGVLKFPQSKNLKNWKLLFPVEDLSTESFDFHYVSQQSKELILTPAFVQINNEDYGNDFLNDDENVEDDDQGKCSGGQGDGSGAHEDNVGKKHVQGKGDVNDHVYDNDIGKNNDLLNEKDDEDDEQGNGNGFNEEEPVNLNYVVENVTKSVGLIDSQEGVSFSQFICDPVVESFLKTLDQEVIKLG
uniref:Uncharacterized protein n=1 Tax=Lactuca sativa TaxID=4236 RepID=A0A9R1XCS9_LACSA|nr:hypothetical protein LSAT_V11C500262920 [Lactuca sativa]